MLQGARHAGNIFHFFLYPFQKLRHISREETSLTDPPNMKPFSMNKNNFYSEINLNKYWYKTI
jgi:hypothetical protein